MPGSAIEAVSDSPSTSFGGVLLAGFSSLMDGVTTLGQLSLRQRLLEQFPEQIAPASTTFFRDPALGELNVVNNRNAFTVENTLNSIKNANPLILGGVALGLVGLYIALR